MKRVAVILLGSLFAVAALQATATTYVRVEKDGTKTYSDRPIPGGKPVDLESAQTYKNEQPTITNTPLGPAKPLEQQLLEQMDDFQYTSCTLMPANDTMFVNPENVTVGVNITPELRADHTLTLMVDGKPVGGPNARTATLTEVFRGQHTVSVVVKNNFGKPMCNATSTFHVQRPSLNSPGRR